jgi:hypothetical protein
MTGNIGIHGGEVGARTFRSGGRLPLDPALPRAANPVDGGIPFKSHLIPFGSEVSSGKGGINTRLPMLFLKEGGLFRL